MLLLLNLLGDLVLAKMLLAVLGVSYWQLAELSDTRTWISGFMSSDRFEATAVAVEA
jgi:hypothetical protein